MANYYGAMNDIGDQMSGLSRQLKGTHAKKPRDMYYHRADARKQYAGDLKGLSGQYRSKYYQINDDYNVGKNQIGTEYGRSHGALTRNSVQDHNAAMKRSLASGLGGSGVAQHRTQQVEDAYKPGFTDLSDRRDEALTNLSRSRNQARNQLTDWRNAQEQGVQSQIQAMAQRSYAQEVGDYDQWRAGAEGQLQQLGALRTDMRDQRLAGMAEQRNQFAQQENERRDAEELARQQLKAEQQGYTMPERQAPPKSSKSDWEGVVMLSADYYRTPQDYLADLERHKVQLVQLLGPAGYRRLVSGANPSDNGGARGSKFVPGGGSPLREVLTAGGVMR